MIQPQGFMSDQIKIMPKNENKRRGEECTSRGRRNEEEEEEGRRRKRLERGGAEKRVAADRGEGEEKSGKKRREGRVFTPTCAQHCDSPQVSVAPLCTHAVSHTCTLRRGSGTSASRRPEPTLSQSGEKKRERRGSEGEGLG